MNQTPRKYRYICINLILIFGFTWSTPGYSQSSPTISKISKTLNIEDSSEELDEGGIGLTYIQRRIIAGEIKESIEWLGQELDRLGANGFMVLRLRVESKCAMQALAACSAVRVREKVVM